MATDQEMLMWLSHILDDIGVVDRRRSERSRLYLFAEKMNNTATRLMSKTHTFYYVGSQIEGTTTLGLESDNDVMVCENAFTVIQDVNDFEPYKCYIFMVQDETIPPGYCYLQVPSFIFDFEQLPDWLHRDREGRLLINHTVSENVSPDFEQHGPAQAILGEIWNRNCDFVRAYRCKKWPPQANKWLLDSRFKRYWPSEELKRECSKTDCFVVPVGCNGSKNELIEWRISTTLAERCLMYSLNTTQIKCYVLMKMILKTHLQEPPLKDSISSYICKTILFHCIANDGPDVWYDRNLVSCLKSCLFKLYRCIKNENCPHFIIPENNLMSGRFSKEIKHALLEKMSWLVEKLFQALLGIECNHFGDLLLRKLKNSYDSSWPRRWFRKVQSSMIKDTIRHFSDFMSNCLHKIRSNEYNQVLCYLLIAKIHSNGTVYEYGELETIVYTLYIQQFATAIGSAIASSSIQQGKIIPSLAFKWMESGLNTDVSSSKLKYASMFYFTGDMKTTEMKLKNVEDMFNLNRVDNICECYRLPEFNYHSFTNLEDVNNLEDTLKYKTAFCVRFSPSESNYIPKELKYEMFRSTPDDVALREECDYWMDYAVVDSIIYLYFLQYKLYHKLDRQEKKQKALNNLENVIKSTIYRGRHKETSLNLFVRSLEQEGHETKQRALNNLKKMIDPTVILGRHTELAPRLIRLCLELEGQETKERALFNIKEIIKSSFYLGHKETALNLLGQCLEQEGRSLDALRCYCSSLKVRRRNNVANIHICRLLSTMINKEPSAIITI